jgi:hypothetical protein
LKKEEEEETGSTIIFYRNNKFCFGGRKEVKLLDLNKAVVRAKQLLLLAYTPYLAMQMLQSLCDLDNLILLQYIYILQEWWCVLLCAIQQFNHHFDRY